MLEKLNKCSYLVTYNFGYFVNQCIHYRGDKSADLCLFYWHLIYELNICNVRIVIAGELTEVSVQTMWLYWGS